MDYDTITEKMQLGLFKPNCALGISILAYRDVALTFSKVLIDLFMRLGYITPDNEPDYMQILTRLHGKFDFEKW
jgi:hypothetical protein